MDKLAALDILRANEAELRRRGVLHAALFGSVARRFVAGMTFEAFVADLRTNHAVVRCLEIVLEASRRLMDAMRGCHPDVPWRDIASIGNVFRHGYHGVKLDIVWRTVHERLPVLVAACRAELVRAPDP